MKKTDILEKLRAFPFGLDGFWVLAGAAMVLYGLREKTGDIDLGCTGEAADRLEAAGFRPRRTSDGRRHFDLEGETEVSEKWLSGSILRVEGIPVVSPDGLREMKLELGREKDLRDISVLDEYRARHGGTLLSTYLPEYRDLWFREALLADEETMAYNRAWGGTVSFPEERWGEWYDHWVARPEGKRFYRYVQDETGVFLGEIAYRFDGETGGNMANVIIHARHRGRGYGGQALELLCRRAKEDGLTQLWDDIAVDNPALDMFLRRGFTEVRRGDGKIRLVKKL